MIDGISRPAEALGDGLSVSADGTTWYKLLDVDGGSINRSGDGLWQLHEYVLGGQLQRINDDYGAGLTLGENFMIKFSQYDDRPFTSDGWAIDKVQVFFVLREHR